RMMLTAVGTFTLTAALGSGTNVKATVTATSSALDIALVSQYSWIAQGASGSVPLTARVLSNGWPVGGRTVLFELMQGSGTLSWPTGLTGADGYAAVNLNLSSVASEIHVSACVMPGETPCKNFYIYAVPQSGLRLEYVGGEQQIINTRQTFSAVQLRVTDSASPPNPVRMAAVSVLT